MIVSVFDDWKSVMHIVVGGATYFFPYYALSSSSTNSLSSLSGMKTSAAHSVMYASSASVSRLSDCCVR